MPVFAVCLEKPNAEVERRIVEHFPELRSYKLTDNLFLVKGDLFSEDVAELVGITGSRVEGAAGSVFKMSPSAYAGYYRNTLWEWLAEAEGVA